MRLTKREQETLVRFDESDGVAIIYTYSSKLQARFSRFAEKHPELARLKCKDKTGAMVFELPKRSLAIYPVEPPTERQRQAARARMLRIHAQNAVVKQNSPMDPDSFDSPTNGMGKDTARLPAGQILQGMTDRLEP